ncbi:MAG: hypothetical protein CUN55_08990, partial [Phototrophicales bacterium]
LKPNLVLVQWSAIPPLNAPIIHQWLKEMWDIVRNATEPVYFITDLRFGCVTDVRALKELAEIANHENCALGVGFSKSISSEVYAGLFARLSRDDTPLQDTLEAALKLLEEHHPGITHDIDWEAVLEAPQAG